MISNLDLLSKPVISIFECKQVGTVSDIYVSKKLKCDYLKIDTPNGYMIVETRNLHSFNYDSVMIKNESTLNMEENFSLKLSKYSTINLALTYSIDGKFCGKVKKIILDDKFCITKIILDNNSELEPNDIFNISNSVCILKDETNKKLNNFKPKSVPKTRKNISNILVTIEKNENATNVVINNNDIRNEDNISKISDNKQSNNNVQTPSTNMLLFRTCTKDIKLNNGEIIVRQGTKINNNIVRKAQIFGKLFELVKFSK